MAVGTHIRDFVKGLHPRTLLSYDKLVGNIPMVALLTLLAIMYIWNRHHAHRQMRELQDLKKELQELHWEHASLKKELNNKSMQTEVSRMVQPLGLEELREPPYKIEADDHQE